MTLRGLNPTSAASSATVGSRPFFCSNSRCTRFSLFMVSTACTGTRMVRAWSAMARVTAFLIHQVA